MNPCGFRLNQRYEYIKPNRRHRKPDPSSSDTDTDTDTFRDTFTDTYTGTYTDTDTDLKIHIFVFVQEEVLNLFGPCTLSILIIRF